MSTKQVFSDVEVAQKLTAYFERPIGVISWRDINTRSCWFSPYCKDCGMNLHEYPHIAINEDSEQASTLHGLFMEIACKTRVNKCTCKDATRAQLGVEIVYGNSWGKYTDEEAKAFHDKAKSLATQIADREVAKLKTPEPAPPRYVVMRAGDARTLARAVPYGPGDQAKRAAEQRLANADNMNGFDRAGAFNADCWCIVDMYSECYWGKGVIGVMSTLDPAKVEGALTYTFEEAAKRFKEGAGVAAKAGLQIGRSQLGPLDQLVDGMTVRQCIEARQANDGYGGHPSLRARIKLTPAQQLAASSEWSRQLREKVKAGEEEDRAREARQCGWDPFHDDD